LKSKGFEWNQEYLATRHLRHTKVEWSIYNSVAEMLMEAVADFERAENILKA